MAVVRVPSEGRVITDAKAIADYLSGCGIDYEQWTPAYPIAVDAPPEEVLRAYTKEVDELKASGGYITADLIDINPQTPGLDAMLSRFNREHWHCEDEVRFIVGGHGVFHIHPKDAPVVAIEVEPGDMIRVPRETRHWFDLCADRRIRAIRLFQDTEGWTPYYSNSGVDQQYQPMCLGLSDLAGTFTLQDGV